MASYQILQFSRNSIINWYKGRAYDMHYLGNDYSNMAVAHEKFGAEWKIISANNTALGSSNIYQIQRSEGMVGNYTLEFTLAAPGSGITWCPLTAFAALDFVVVRLGRDVLRYNSETLYEYLTQVNFDRTRTDLFGNTCIPSTWPTSGTLGSVSANVGCTCFIPIIAPGNLGNVASHQTPFPVGKTKYNLEIEIYMKAGTAFSTGGTTAISVMTNPRLHYKKYVPEGLNPYIVDFNTSNPTAVQTYKFLDFAYDTRTYSLTAGSDTQLLFDRINRNADMIWLGVMASQNTNSDRFLGELSPQITLDVNGYKFYEHYNYGQSSLLHIKTWGESESKSSITQARYVQTLPLCTDPKETAITNVGMNAPNLQTEKPTLMYRGPAGSSSTTYYITLYAVYNTLINIQGDGEIAMIQTWLPNFTTLAPTTHEKSQANQSTIRV